MAQLRLVESADAEPRIWGQLWAIRGFAAEWRPGAPHPVSSKGQLYTHATRVYVMWARQG